jgi:hypothetical protein
LKLSGVLSRKNPQIGIDDRRSWSVDILTIGRMVKVMPRSGAGPCFKYRETIGDWTVLLKS